MTNSNRRLISPRIAFIALALLINLTVSGVADGRLPVEIAGSFDLTVTVTALYYWLIVRRGLRAPVSLFSVAAFGLLRAAFAFPRVVPGKEFLTAGIECVLLAILLIGFFRRADADPVERFRRALTNLLPFETAERALASELSVLYYAFAWRARPHVPDASEPFTFHKRSGFRDIILGIGLASLFETLPLHLVLRKWSAIAAWVLTALSIYGAVWLVALARSFALRPGVVQANEATIRLGLLFTLRIPARCIARIGSDPVAGALRVPRRTEPNICIEFTEPLEAERMFGIRKRVTSIALTADDPAALTAALRRMAY